MFVCDVILGTPYIPKTRCSYPPSGYDSIYAKGGISGVLNNEFIVFKKNQVNIRYLLELK